MLNLNLYRSVRQERHHNTSADALTNSGALTKACLRDISVRKAKAFRPSTLMLLAVIASYAGPASAITVLTSASQLSATDVAFYPTTANVNGGSTPAAVGSVYSSSSLSFSVSNTSSNNELTFSGASNGYEVDQVGLNYGLSAFSGGTILLGAGGFQGSAGGPVTLTFAEPIDEFGVNIEDFNSGPYDVSFLALDAAGNAILYASVPDDASLAGNDPSSLSFVGFSASGDPITQIQFDDVYNSVFANNGSDNLLFGNLEYLDAATSIMVGEPAPTATPDPPSIALCGFGLLLATVTSRRLLART